MWLTPAIVSEVQRDFAALYDDLVDRSVQFQWSEAGWTINRVSGMHFNADSDSIPMTRILTDFDENNGYVHVPHPFPILPISIAPVDIGHFLVDNSEETTKSKGLKSLLRKKDKKHAKSETSQSIPQSWITKFQLAYSNASNSLALAENYHGNRLAEAFLKYEQTTDICKVDPRVARRGRWLFVYGILQTLASVSESVPSLDFPTDALNYFTCTSLKGCPHWTAAKFESAQMTTSHCWKVPGTWPVETTKRPREHSFMPGLSSPNSPKKLDWPASSPTTAMDNDESARGNSEFDFELEQARPPAYSSGGLNHRAMYRERPLPSPTRAPPLPPMLAETYARDMQQEQEFNEQFQRAMSQGGAGQPEAVYYDEEEDLYNDPGPYSHQNQSNGPEIVDWDENHNV